MAVCERLRAVLGTRRRFSLDGGKAVRCAVLVPLLQRNDGYHVLYTVRSDNLPDHRGQVAFPGGKHAPADVELLDTALRETREEVGIEPGLVDVLGCLDDVATVATRYVVTPYVGVVALSARIEANPNEVAEVFTVAVDDLRNPARRPKRVRTWNGTTYEVDVIEAGAHEIWGVTLSITRNLVACLDEGMATL